MKENPLTKGNITEGFTGLGTVTHEMVLKRARELALINGHNADHVSKAEFAQAKRELTGGADIDPEEADLESVPESERGKLLGSTGRKVPESSDEDEDDEGRSESERLVEEGVSEAEHDQMLQAAKAAAKKDKEGV